MSFHERLDDRNHRGGLRLGALEGVDHQREPVLVGQQADGDLRLQAAFLGEARLPEPVPGIGLEIQGADVENELDVGKRRKILEGEGLSLSCHPLLLVVSGAGRALTGQRLLPGGFVHVCNDGEVAYEWDEQAWKEAAAYPVSAPDADMLRAQCSHVL